MGAFYCALRHWYKNELRRSSSVCVLISFGSSPRSAYSRTALPGKSYFRQPITGTIGRHLPKEVVRIERDWSDGEVCQ
jgi:hypothetical protein